MWLFDKMLRRVVRRGELTVIDHRGEAHRYGRPDPQFAPLTVRLRDASTPNWIARRPRMGAAEAFIEGRLTIEQGDIRGLVDLMRANTPWERRLGLANKGPLMKLISKSLGSVRLPNNPIRSRRNVAHHYDLGNDFYRLFLDEDMQYSCAYFAEPGVDLERAQRDELVHIAAKLDLRSGMKVLDIGCGWGGMALFLYEHFDVDVLGITLSKEQIEVARQRAAEAGVAQRVHFALQDYRDVQGPFDRIVSVGMFEHVGRAHFGSFFRKCRELLSEDGVMLLHTIGQMGGPKPTDAFTLKYIFPGGYIPSLSEIVLASEPTRLIAADIETLRLHYMHTLDHWYDRTVAARERIVAMYDERFYRIWTFYLAGARGAFAHGGLCNYQIQYIRKRSALPITRDYQFEVERQLRDTRL